MGWAGGSGLMNEVIAAIVPEVPDPAVRERIYGKLIEAFENEDWDTQSESTGRDQAFDDALKSLYPEWFE